MTEYVLPAFEERILSVDKSVVLISAKYHVPVPKPYRDTLIAATAVVHNMTIVTRDTAGFCLGKVKAFNSWNYKE